MQLLTNQDFIDCGKLINVDPLVIRTVAVVESKGNGFLDNGDLKILFEPHVFWHLLVQKGKNPRQLLATTPNLSGVLYEKWKTLPYGKYSEQWDKLRLAAQYDMEAAHQSASYGKFQIMGFNHADAGYNNVFTMVNKMRTGEGEHLKAFANFCQSKKLDYYLRNKMWKQFAIAFNGSGYRNGTENITDDYDYKLEHTYSYLKSTLNSQN